MKRTLEQVSAYLGSQRVSFAVIGATAMAIHGVSRATQDVDLLAMSSECLRVEFWEPLRALGLRIDVRNGDDDDPLAGVVRIVDVDEDSNIDVIIGKPPWQRELLSRAQSHEVEGVELPIAQARDVVLLKLYAGGVQDRWDIAQLLVANPSIVDDVESAVTTLPPYCQQLWRDVRGAAR
jgi:predicted nucleotidyltransferase